MNIFALSNDVKEIARWQMNRHCTKMPTESAQMLCTVHRTLDGSVYIDKSSGRSIKRWKLNDDREYALYKAGHVNHPSVVWTRENNSNYLWHFDLFVELLNEYQYRYGKIHACTKLISYLKTPPKNIPNGKLTPVTPAMPSEYIIPGDFIGSYRKYYIEKKQHLADWSGKVNGREIPPWYK